MKLTAITLLLALLALLQSPAIAQTAEEAKALFEQRKATIITNRNESMKGILIKYNKALKGLKDEAKASGNLDNVLLIDRLQTVSAKGKIPLTEDVSSFPRLDQLHKAISKEAIAIRKDAFAQYDKLKKGYEAALEGKIVELTKAGDIDGAKAMKKQLEYFRNPELAVGDNMAKDRKDRREAHEKKTGKSATP